MGRLAGLSSVVTGAGSGIGAASALAFAREGASVLVADVSAESAERTASDIRAAGGTAEEIAIDVTNAEQVERMVQTAVDRFGKLDILFNNAGIPQSFTPFEDSTDALYDRLFDVNVRGVVYGCRAAIPHMKAG